MEEKMRPPGTPLLPRQRHRIIPAALLLLILALGGVVAMAPAMHPTPTGPTNAGAYPAPGGAAMPLFPKQATGRTASPDGPLPDGGGAPPPVEVHPSAARPGFVWLIETVDAQYGAGAGTSLALDARGLPHIAYRLADGSDLRYASFDGGAWVTETVDAFGLTGIMPSLALDAADHPHICYFLGGDYGDLKYAYHDGQRWFTTTVDSQGIGGSCSLALDAQGQPHIGYDNGLGCLMYAHHDGQNWLIEVVACGPGWYGWCTSLKLDEKDSPHISYCDCWPNADLRYAWLEGGTWYTELVDPSDGLHTSLVLDGAHPHISYYDATPRALKHAWLDGTAWQLEVIDDSGDGGTYSSLALDAAGHLHVSYKDEENSRLRYAYFDGSFSETAWRFDSAESYGARSTGTGRWLSETVPGTGWVGGDISLALDAAGRPRISYRGPYQRLMYVQLLELPITIALPRLER